MDMDMRNEHGHGQDMDVNYYRTSTDSGQLYFSEYFAEDPAEVSKSYRKLVKAGGNTCKAQLKLAEVLEKVSGT
jgi:hypothetical protein